MLTAASAAAGALESESREANAIDNQQVLEFLRLVDELRQVAALLEIRPAGAKLRVKRSTSA
jgi:hypothetical protein